MIDIRILQILGMNDGLNAPTFVFRRLASKLKKMFDTGSRGTMIFGIYGDTSLR